jgi:hypothetical protein
MQAAVQVKSARGARAIGLRVVCALLCFGVLEAAIFHTPLYPAILEPDSTAGTFELVLRNETRRPKPDRSQVLAVGHSRMALQPRIANSLGTGYTFASIALGGTTPRAWFYALRAVDPEARRYAAILIPSDDYDEPDNYDYQSEREADLHYLIARLGLRDLFDFPWTYRENKLRWAAFAGILFKGFVYRSDFLAFVAHPSDRLQKVRQYNRDYAGWAYNFAAERSSLAGIRIDWQNQTVTFPDGIPADARKRIAEELFPPMPPDEGRQTAYLRYWYRRIADHYRGSGTKLFFLRVPRAPIAPPPHPPKRDSAVRQLASLPDVVVLDEHLFDPLERPELFMDGLHLNREGLERFSRILAAEVRKYLGPRNSPQAHAL